MPDHPTPAPSEAVSPSGQALDALAPEAAPACAPSAVALRRQLRRLSQLPEAPWLHQEVARRLAEKLGPIRLTPRDWIDWSAWLGAGAVPVQARYPVAQRWVVEPHAALAARSLQAEAEAAPRGWRTLWRKPDPSERVHTEPVSDPAPWRVPDAQGLQGAQGVQMLWANMALHGASDLPGLLAGWHRHLAVEGFLMCSGLGPDTARELRAVYRGMGWPLPTIDFIDMHDLGDELVRAGFADPVMDMERLTLTWASPQAMLDELRTWGGNVAHGRFAGLRTRAWRDRLLAAIDQHMRQPDGRIALTVELVYGHALKPMPRAKLAPETRVTLADMRQMVRKKGQP
ncbi:biotin synthase [Aquabacterium sp.]|uniref:biotin synthase n=1 Tax=Aquabacterium sp. TaxID=1872578 RepID=UPI0025C0E5EC|nr:biotin synthase [Aquabacterium sp.]